MKKYFTKQKNTYGLSIVIPVYNEKINLKILIPKIYQILKVKKFEILIVDDDSKDGTRQLLKKMSLLYKNLKYILRKTKPKDLSKSCVLGFNKSKYNNILVMDGDLQHSAEAINSLYSVLLKTQCDVVVGSRNLFTKRQKGLKFYRLITSILLVLIVNIFLGFKTSDPMSGFFIFKKKIYLRNKKFLFNRGYKILLDLIYSSQQKIKILDLYINFKSRSKGSSKMSFKIIYFLGLAILRNFYFRISNIIK
jgi:dolichol-phosphate mannosyltransferase|tara:strand:+ start:176 stop:925 length:750 start_codon:yes stop_codon:yes gene_type:complete